jgi:hypothetical protein
VNQQVKADQRRQQPLCHREHGGQRTGPQHADRETVQHTRDRQHQGHRTTLGEHAVIAKHPEATQRRDH